jgi:hypothetical protein
MSREQKQYDVVMVNVREILYSEYGLKAALDQVRTAQGGPAQGIGNAAAMTVKSVFTGLKEKGKNVDPKVLAGALAETVADLTELCVSAGLVQENEKKAVSKAAMAEASKALKGATQQGAPATKQGAQQPQQPQGLVQNAMEA